MTESQWLASNDPRAMLEFIAGAPADGFWLHNLPIPSDRKLLLFAVAGCRQWPTDTHPEGPSTVDAIIELAERRADGESVLNEMLDLLDPWEHISSGLVALGGDPANAAHEFASAGDHGRGREFAALLRDIVGNPFRPPKEFRRVTEAGHIVDYRTSEMAKWLKWNHGTVPNLAQRIYDDRAFHLMPILADALEDASCTDVDILNHCRGLSRCSGGWRSGDVGVYRVYESAGPDSGWLRCDQCSGRGWAKSPVACVRGCWAIDILLGKE